MSLNIILGNALSGLVASQSAIVTTSQNVANANSVGYTRQVIHLEQRANGGVANGVEVSGISREIDTFLLRETRVAAAAAGLAQVRAGFYAQIAALFGSPEANASLANDLGRFSTAVERLALNPEDPTLRFNVVATGEALARNTRQAAASVQTLRGEADRQIADAVGEANQHLRSIFDLNRMIAQANATGQDVPDLMDRRDQAVLALAELIGVSTFERDSGAIAVFTTGGQALIDAELRQLSYSPTATVQAGTVFGALTATPVDSQTLVPVGDGQVIVSSGTSDTVVSGLVTGRVQGLLSMRDGELPALALQLEAFAAKLRDAVNAVHNDGVSFPAPSALTGTATVAGGDPFAATGTMRIAIVDAGGTVVGTPVDLDFGTLGAATVNDVVIAINAALGADGSAAIVNGKLVIRATNPAHGVAINGGTTVIGSTGRGFSHHFGLNDFFIGTGAADLAVRPDLLANPARVTTAALSTTAASGAVALTIGDNRAVSRLAELFEAAQPFAAVSGLPAAQITLGSFVATMIGQTAIRASAASDEVSRLNALLGNLQFRMSSQSGVNIDEELGRLVLFQNAYQASARVMSVAQQMFDDLIGIIG
ncbi:MAG: flagellar hook-associated protein FlgK [Alphaproteobacteria bacterium]